MLVCFGMPTAVWLLWRQCDVCATASASDGMLLSGVPIPGCRSPLPLLPRHFRKSASGCSQPPPAGGPRAADLSNCTRRASRLYPAPPGPTRCRGAQGICPLPGARTALGGPGRTVRSCSCSWVAAGQARCGRRGTNAGPLLRAGAVCKPVASDWRLGARPRQSGPCRDARYRSTDCARLAARACCATKHDNCAGVSVA